MMHLTDLTGLAGCTLAIIVVLLHMPGVARLPGRVRAAWAVAAAILLVIPVGGLPAAAYVRGVLGDLSITTLGLLVHGLLRPLHGWVQPAPRERPALLTLVVAAAVFLYPMALGWGYFDPYRLGYGDPWMLGGLWALALLAWAVRAQMLAACLALAVTAWNLGWYESTNLWDYLLDAPLALYALGSLLRLGLHRLAQFRRA